MFENMSLYELGKAKQHYIDKLMAMTAMDRGSLTLIEQKQYMRSQIHYTGLLKDINVKELNIIQENMNRN